MHYLKGLIYFLLFVVIFIAASAAHAAEKATPMTDIQKGDIGEIALSSKVPFKFYGFISAEAM